MTTPSRDTVVFQENDLWEGFAPSGRQRGTNSASVRDRFNVIPSEVEGSRYVMLKVPQGNSSVPAGLAVTLGMTRRDSRFQNASSGSFTLRARSSNRVNSF